MYNYEIDGKKVLSGTVSVSGSKNSSLPIIAATILNENINELYNIPKIEDVNIMLKIIEELGCKIIINEEKIIINSNSMNHTNISDSLMKRLRASIVLAGAILGRFKHVTFSYPGGCNIGKRPIDLHIKNFKKLGAVIEEKENHINCTLNNIKSGTLFLEFPSVGVTENLMLLSVLGNHEVVIKNAAKEPEIVDLSNFLNVMGAKIFGAGTENIKIEGVKSLNKTSYTIIPDRIEAGTLLAAIAITRGEGKIEKVSPEHLISVIEKLKEIGCKIVVDNESIYINAHRNLNSVFLKTLPYPGFPTDMQPIFTSLLLSCNGETLIDETIFENRYNFISQLEKMKANFKKSSNKLFFKGPQELVGAEVECTDLRGGASIVLAGLSSYGKTIVSRTEYILRGYENLDYKLNKLGARINRV